MADASFYMIHIERNPENSAEEVKEKMDLAVDWYRMNSGLWFLYSTSSVDKWYERLAPLCKPTGNLFICKLDTEERQGWMSKDFWAWLKREKKSKEN